MLDIPLITTVIVLTFFILFTIKPTFVHTVNKNKEPRLSYRSLLLYSLASAVVWYVLYLCFSTSTHSMIFDNTE